MTHTIICPTLTMIEKNVFSRARARAARAARAQATELSFEYYTKCPNLRFLSYWAGLLSQRRVISRVKLTCLTTV